MPVMRVVLALGIAALASTSVHAEDVLTTTTALPRNLVSSVNFLKWVAHVNAEGKGIVRIDYRGGPEAIPTFEQGQAVRKGVVDMIYTPASYNAGTVPEADVLISSTVPPMETRKNGGFELLNQILQKKMEVYLLANFEAKQQFHIWLRTPPKFKPDGMVDLSNVKMRGSPVYRDFFASLGAIFVNLPPGEVYTALERGAVDGTGWPRMGVRDANWEQFLKYRVDPGFYSVDLVALINLDKWRKLSPRARDLLQKLAIEHEPKSIEDNVALAKREDDELRKHGVQFVSMQPAGAKKFLDLGYKLAWDRIKARDPSNADRLREAFYRPQ